jgi:predicted O-linked N-acetylglucosamine transferase (SPINDLY family)
MLSKFQLNQKPKQAMTSSQAKIQAQFGQAIVLHQMGQLKDAQVIYEKILRSNPKHVDALHLLGVLSSQLNKHQLASDLIGKAIAISPNNAAFYSNRGIALHQLSQFDAAVASYDQAIHIKPDYAEAYYNRGLALRELKQFEASLAGYDMAIRFNPNHAGAFANRGNALKELNHLEPAAASYEQAIRLIPDDAATHYNLGLTLQKLEKFESAISSYNTAISINPNLAEAYGNLGAAQHKLKLLDVAIASFDQAISLNPNYVQAYSNRGISLYEQKQYDAAVASYDKAISINPNYAEAHSNRGNALLELKQLDEAVASYDMAVSITPDYADAYNNRGNALHQMDQFDAALASYDQAINIQPDFSEAYSNRGNTLIQLKKIDAAIDSYSTSLSINPNTKYLLGTLLFTKMMTCDWNGIHKETIELISKIKENFKSSESFTILALTSSLQIQLNASKICVNDKYPYNLLLGGIVKSSKKSRIKIGYFSADFYCHATAYLMAELFERHNRNDFEIFAFSYGPDKADEMQQRLSKSFDKFIDVRLKTDRAIAELSREMGIDIAVDLKGLTYGGRLSIFAYRAAPIQVHYIGYPGTSGTEYIDYLIADKVIIPVESQQYYSEKVVYLPNSYQVNDRYKIISDYIFNKPELGLPDNGVIYCCFNNNYKITPEVFGCWVRILNAVDKSVLWLLEDNMTAASNLQKEAMKRGLDPNRLVFAKRAMMAEHLARHKIADLFLDTLPCNAHTTASDALWAGLPVLTCLGESFASRVAASLLKAIGLPELITETQEAYEVLAIYLGRNPEELEKIKTKLRKNRMSTPLFDTEIFTTHIESAYTQMYERYHDDLPPDTLFID